MNRPPKKPLNKGGTLVTKSGRITRTYGLGAPVESIDTTGYSKGRKDFQLQKSYSGGMTSRETIKRENVPSVIENLRRGATRTINYPLGKNGKK